MLQANQYKLQPIKDWDDLLGAYKALSTTSAGGGKGWIYRGEKSVNYDMATSLERAAVGFGYHLKELPLLEQKLLRQFKRRLHHYTTDVPHKKDTVEWLALMQHYGAPTRLLDWTYSFFVAVYFAVEAATEKECVVWALRMDTFNAFDTLTKAQNAEVIKRYRRYKREDTSLKEAEWLKQSALVDHLLKHRRPLIHSVNPFRLNERLTIQQGVFLMPGDVSKSFEYNLATHPNLRRKLIKFKINNSTPVRKEILLNLHQMNISRASLFPGLAGFAESLRTRLAFHELMK